MKVTMFTSETCMPCRHAKVILEKFKGEFPDIDLVYVDIIKEADLVTRLGVQSVPMIAIGNLNHPVKIYQGLGFGIQDLRDMYHSLKQGKDERNGLK